MYKAKCADKDDEVAIRVIDLDNSLIDFDGIRSEIEKIRLCKHPNVLPLNCCFCVRNFMWIVTPFMKKGSLYRILNIVRDSKQTPAVQGLSVRFLQDFHC